MAASKFKILRKAREFINGQIALFACMILVAPILGLLSLVHSLERPEWAIGEAVHISTTEFLLLGTINT